MSLWDDDENQEFRDIPDETGLDENGQPKSAPAARVQQTPRQQAPSPQQAPFNAAKGKFEVPAEVNVEEILEIIESEEDFSEVLNDDNLRIEQGRLYQMIMNHDLFDGMDADVKAVQNV